MKYFFSFLIILFILILQVSFLPHFEIYNIAPNLFLITLVSWVILRQRQEAYFWAAASGLLLDLNSQIFFGTTALSFLITILILLFFTRNFINVENLISKIVIVFLATLFYNFISLAILEIVNFFKLYPYSQFLSKNFFIFLLIEIILNIILMFLIYPLMRGFHRFILRYEAKRKAGA